MFFAVIALLCAGCNTENTSGQGQGDVTKPPPEVWVEAMPSATATLPLPTDVVTPTIEPTATAEVYVWATPDVEAQMNQIEANMAELQRELDRQKFILKP
jgi:hypothetical protein